MRAYIVSVTWNEQPLKMQWHFRDNFELTIFLLPDLSYNSLCCPSHIQRFNLLTQQMNRFDRYRVQLDGFIWILWHIKFNVPNDDRSMKHIGSKIKFISITLNSNSLEHTLSKRYKYEYKCVTIWYLCFHHIIVLRYMRRTVRNFNFKWP